MKWRIGIAVISIAAAAIFLRLHQPAPDPLWNGRKISAWTSDLLSPNPQTESQAHAVLLRIGQPATPHLAKLLRQKPPGIPAQFASIANRIPFLRESQLTAQTAARPRAIEILALLGPHAALALPEIIPLLDDSSETVIQDTEHLLRRIGAPSGDALARALQKHSEPIRVRAAHALRDFPSDLATDTLTKSLQDKSPAVRAAAAESLGHLHATNSYQGLLNALADPDQKVRARTCEALGAIVEKSSIPKLMAMRRDHSPSVQLEAAKALWKMNRDPAPILPTLIRLLSTDQSWQAAYTLAEMRAEAAPAIPALIAAMRREQVPRPFRSPASATFALGQIGAPAVPALIEALQDHRPIQRANAALALGIMDQSAASATDSLLQCLNDSNPDVREAAALTLGHLGSTDLRAINALSDCLRAEDIFVRSIALTLLRQLAPNQEWAASSE